MEKVIYDLEKLAENDFIDTGAASRFFYTMQDYFDKLTEYTKNYHSYIHHYNPTVVVVSDAERDVFIADCANVRAQLTQLGMNAPLGELNNMENAALSGAIKELSDGLLKFQGMLEIAAKQIRNARKTAGEQLKKKKLVVVHDDSNALKSLSKMLDERYNVITLRGGPEAFKELAAHMPEVILIFTEMDGICAYELAYFIREEKKFKHTPIFFLTGAKNRSALREGLPSAEKHYINMPVKKDVLLQTVENALIRE